MELKDLFVSYKQVDPVKFEIKNTDLPTPIYLNKDRAAKVVSKEDNTESTDMSTWNADSSNLEDESSTDWSVEDTLSDDQKIENKSENNQEIENSNKLSNSSNFKLSTKLNTQYVNWINSMIKSYKKLGLNDNAIKNLIAQTALESNYGQSTLSGYNNFGGITTGSYWTGKRIKSGDKDKDGHRITQDFRVYDNMDHFTKDHLEFLTKLYDFDQNDDLNTFLNKLLGNNKGKRKYAQAKDYNISVTNRYNQIFG